MEQRTSMKINAYILLGDPAFLRESLSAYYPYVDEIHVSYDRAHTSWTGTPLPMNDCLRIVDEVDTEHKCVLVPGDFARLDETPMANDTFQRQNALDSASEHADWVLQLDTDEVMRSPDAFFMMLDRADAAGMIGLDFPSWWVHSRVAPGRYLAAVDRFWRPVASYPGPLAIRAGSQLRHARQADGDLYRVDFRPRSTDPWRARDARVDDVVPVDDAVVHFSWVRAEAAIRRKFGWSGHTEAMRPPKVYRRWAWRTAHPVLTNLAAPIRRNVDGRYGLVSIAEPPGGEPIAGSIDDSHLG